MFNVNLTKEEIIFRIGYFRNKRNLSAYDLSLKLGHSKNYMYRIESGHTELTIELLLQILEILGVSTFEFFYCDLNSYNSDIDDLKLLKSLTIEERNALKTLLK